jgi:HCOMODA/2-hydroxy-3-carboxy-muconic semialdehyde decarboxylase
MARDGCWTKPPGSAFLAGTAASAATTGREPLPRSLDDIRYELALANRMVAHEGVLDAFGHVSVRHPDDPGRYFLSRSRAPELVEPGDLVEFTLDSEPVKPQTVRLYGERVIHGEIYKARPDVTAVCHHHSAAFMPYCVSGEEVVPVYHLGAVIGAKAPFWDQRDDFGDTNLLVIKPEEGASLARALGPHWVVVMRRHGATVAGRTLREVVFRTIYSCRNAEYLTQAKLIGRPSPLNAREAELAGEYNLGEGPVSRAWEYWSMRLEKAGEAPPRAARSAPRPTARARPASRARARGASKTAGKRRR